MNRGTALKWAAALDVTAARFDVAQLGFWAGGERYLSPLGVLADFLDPDGWSLAWDGVSTLWHGEQFYLPDWALKRCKMKTDGHAIMDLDGPFYHHTPPDVDSHADAAAFVRERYAEI